MSNSAGYWGPTDALVDWCEANYIITWYIAEFYNTISSIPITILGIIGIIVMYLNQKREIKNEYRFIVTFTSLGLVGIGSLFYHMTLRYYGQLFDELPMMLGSLCLLFCIFMTDSIPNKSNIKIILIFIFWGILQIYLYIIYKWYWLFLLNYGGQTFCQIIFGYTKCKKFANNLCKKLFISCISLYLIGLFLWIIDQKWCKQLQKYQLHAIWHLCAGYASYLAIYTAIVCRAKYLNLYTNIKLIKICNTLPIAHCIVFVDKES